MSSPILALKDITVDFEGFKALQNLTFSMAKGELRVIIGPNGAGKTTLLDVITGKTRPIGGTATFLGTVDLLDKNEHEVANLGIGRKFQTPSVFPYHSVFENMELALKHDRRVLPVLLARLTKAQKERIYSLLETIGLLPQALVPAGSLSHGQKQWLEIGMLMAQDPQLILLDEPVAGMTGPEREQTVGLLNRIRDHSLLVIEHDMHFVRQIANKVTVLHEGTVLCEGSLQEVQNDPVVMDVYLGRSMEEEADAHR